MKYCQIWSHCFPLPLFRSVRSLLIIVLYLPKLFMRIINNTNIVEMLFTHLKMYIFHAARAWRVLFIFIHRFVRFVIKLLYMFMHARSIARASLMQRKHRTGYAPTTNLADTTRPSIFPVIFCSNHSNSVLYEHTVGS